MNEASMASTTLGAVPVVHAEAAERVKTGGYMNPYLAGIGLGLVLLASFVFVGRGLGASGAFNASVAWIEHGTAPDHVMANVYLSEYIGDGSSHPLKTWLIFEMLGVFAGALVSGLLAGRVRASVEKGPRVSTAARMGGAFVGGMLMAVGAHLARGCTSGQALTGGALLNAGSWAFMLCVFGGAYAVARLMRWEWR